MGSKRVVTRLSDEQYAVLLLEAQERGLNEADMLRFILRDYFQYHQAIYWPDDDPKHGGEREGAGWPKGRPRKSGGKKSKIAT